MRSPADALLYGIIDLGYVAPEDAPGILEKLIAGGIDMVQLRGKNYSIDELSLFAEELLQFTAPAEIPLIANDHAQIAQRVDVQGVHVGQDDESIKAVRAQVERPIIVGKSTHSVKQAMAAEREGADYIGLGPIFPTPTKPDYPPIGPSQIHEVRKRVSVPIFCIGGIKLENLKQLLAAGARSVVIVSGLLQANDVVGYTRACKKLVTDLRPVISGL
ncbi:MAG: thiamine phosphate synthase [Verrucomicrobia bacterium]|nr:MAG: thiamine phosphate synthase [Verrucomicrobiota bacterium]PYL47182.1 MAG: thiamine phosphate synthase [Verrucomicrobiota bacterium]